MAEGCDKFIHVNGLRLHYVEHGRSRDPTIVCLHGTGGHGRSWDSFASAISDTHHVLALTFRGHGDSDRARSYAWPTYIEDTLAFIEATGSAPAILCGSSMGSGTALGLASMHADAVAKLIAVDGGPEADSRGVRRVTDAFVAMPSTFDTLEEAIDFHRVLLPGVATDELRHYVEHNLIRDDDGKLRLKTDPELLRAFVQYGAEEDPDATNLFWKALETIRCPTPIVRGSSSDVLSRACAERMLQVIANSELVEIEAGHAVPLENPSAFLAAVRAFV